MKKSSYIHLILVFVVIVIVGYCLYCIHLDKASNVLISEDYSTISYNEKVYCCVEVDDVFLLPDFPSDWLWADVENQFFIWNGFLTNYVSVSEDGKWLQLHTDYDYNISDYYRLIDGE